MFCNPDNYYFSHFKILLFKLALLSLTFNLQNYSGANISHSFIVVPRSLGTFIADRAAIQYRPSSEGRVQVN